MHRLLLAVAGALLDGTPPRLASPGRCSPGGGSPPWCGGRVRLGRTACRGMAQDDAGRRLATGIYLMRLRAAGGTATDKVLLLR